MKTPEEEPEIFLVGQGDFERFAKECGHVEMVGRLVWKMVLSTAKIPHPERDEFPTLNLLADEAENPCVDLWNVVERLKHQPSAQNQRLRGWDKWDGWRHGGEDRLAFLRAMCETKLGIDIENEDS